MKRRALDAAVLLLAAGCSKGSPAPTGALPAPVEAPQGSVAPSATVAATPIPDASAPPTPAATMKLLDPGQLPRRKLRYAWHVDRKEQLTMDLHTSASTEVAGARQPDIPLPPVHIAIAIDPQSVSADGDLRYAWRVTNATVAATTPAPSQVADGMRAEVAAVEHLTGTGVVTASGLSREVLIDPGTATDAGATGQMVEQVRQTLRDLAAPLPDEEVGRGARWQKLSQLDNRDAHLTQTETFSLVDLQGDKGTLDDVLAQTAPAQALRAPGMPEGAQARMESMLASGDAKTRFDLSRLVPQTKFDGTTTMVVTGQAAGDTSRRVTMIMRVGIGIQGTTR